MNTDKGRSKNRKSRFTIITVVLLVALPLLYAASVVLFWFTGDDIVYLRWKQFDLPEAGSIYIPKEWSVSKSDDGLIDTFIFASDGEEDGSKTDTDPLFVCYKPDDYQRAKQEGAVYEGLDVVISKSQTKAQGRLNGMEWSEFEYYDDEIGTTVRLYMITTYYDGGYVMISTADSVKPGTVFKIVQSYRFL